MVLTAFGGILVVLLFRFSLFRFHRGTLEGGNKVARGFRLENLGKYFFIGFYFNFLIDTGSDIGIIIGPAFGIFQGVEFSDDNAR